MRVVDLEDRPVEYVDEKQKGTLGGRATSHFAEHIQSSGQPPKDLTYAA